MRTQAIVPVKDFTVAKQRLMEHLSPGPRRALVEAMFSDVLVALRRAERVDEVVVISSDRDAQEIAGGYGAGILDDEQLGHSEAASLAIATALESRRRASAARAGRLPAARSAGNSISCLLARLSRRPC